MTAYAIRGGEEGTRRLDLLSRVVGPGRVLSNVTLRISVLLSSGVVVAPGWG